MVKCLVFEVCLMTITMLNCGCLAFDETCADLEFEGLTNGETVRVEQYSNINVTFHLNTSKCPDSGDPLRLRVILKKDETSVDVCMLLIKKQHCVPIDRSHCQCLSSPRGWARMFRSLNVSGQVFIVWRWYYHKSSSHQGTASIMFNVSSDFHTEEKTTVFQSDATRRQINLLLLTLCIYGNYHLVASK